MATKLGTLTLDLVAKIGNFTQGMRQASSSAEREMQRASSSVNIMNGMLGKLAATAGAAFSVNQIKNYADSYTGMVNKLKLVTSTQSELSRAMDDTHKIAQATASDWNGVLDVYTKFQGLSKRLGIDQAEVARITETVTKTVSMSGQSAAASEAALLQFGQALNTGVLRGAELVSVMSQAPALAKALADGMGVAVGDLKKLGEEGKITSEVMRDALLKMSSSVDAEYAKTATTVSASFNLITTEATKLIGEFDQAHGVSKTFVEGMTLVAENIGNITKVMMVAGAYMAGKYIALLTATAIGYVRNTVEVVRYQMALAGMQANAVGAARSLVLLRAASSAALGVLLSPVGLGVAVASVAAGYLLMKGNADKATASIDTQGKSVGELIEKYRELNTLQRDNETKALADQVEELSLKYRVASSDLLSFMESLPIADDKIATFRKLNSELSQGRISTDDYYKSIKEVNILTDDQLSKVRTLIGAYTSNKEKLNEAKVAQDALSSSMTGTTQKAKEQAIGVAQLSEAIKKLLKESNQTIKDSAITSALANRGYNDTMIELAKKYLNVEGAIVTNAKGQKVLKDELKTKLREEYQAIMRSKNAVDERNKAEEKSKKLLEATGNAMKVNAKVAANAAKYNFAAIEAKNKLPSGLLSAIHMQESKGNPNAYNKSSGAAGGFQFLEGTAKQYGVKDRYNLAQSAEGAGKYMAYLLDLFKGDLDKAVSAYHAGEGNVQRGTNIGPVNRQYVKNIKGYLGGSSGVSFTEDYSFDDWLKELEQRVAEQEKLEKEMAEKQKALALEVSTYREKINSELADKLEEIDKAGFDSAKTAELKAEYKKRAEIDIQVSDAAHSEKLAGYSDYLKSEEQLLNESFARRQRDLKLDLSLTSEEYTIASIALENQRKKEVESLRRDERLDVLETKRDWMGKGEYAREYYALVREEILATSTYSPEKKEAMLQYASSQQNREESYERDSAIADYRDVMGYGENPLERQFEVLQKMRELDLLNEEAYQNAKLELQAKSTAGYMEGMLGGFASLVDENSKTYAVLFAAQKAFAVAQAMLNIPAAYSKAYDAVVGTPFVGPYIAPAVGAAAAALQVAQAASMKSVNLTGMAHDGIDNIPTEGTWLLDGGERVLNPEQNKDLTRYLSEARESNSSPNVNLNPNFVIVDEREKLGDYLFGPDGKKAFVKFFKQNKRELGFA